MSRKVTIGTPSLSARRIRRCALRNPSGCGEPKLRAMFDSVSVPFWCPMIITGRPSSSAGPPTIAGSSPKARSPWSSKKPSRCAAAGRASGAAADDVRAGRGATPPRSPRGSERRSARWSRSRVWLRVVGDRRLACGCPTPDSGHCLPLRPRRRCRSSRSPRHPGARRGPESAPIGPHARSASSVAASAATGHRQEAQEPAEAGTQLRTRHDRVDEAVREEELGALESLGELLADRVGGDPRARRSR